MDSFPKTTPTSVTSPQTPPGMPTNQLSPADASARASAMSTDAFSRASGTNSPNFLNAPPTPLISSNSNPNILSAADANAYTKNVQQNLAVNYGTASNGGAIDQSGNVTPVAGQTTNDWLNKPTAGFNPADPIGSLARQAYSPIEARINAQYAPHEQDQTTAERNSTLSNKAAQVSMGQAGTTYGQQAMNDLAISHNNAWRELETEKQTALGNAWDASLRGAAGDVMREQNRMDGIKQAQADLKVKAAKDMQSIADANKAIRGDVSDTINSYLTGGNMPNDTQLSYWDKAYNLDPGTSKILLDAAQATKQITDAKTFNDQRNAAVDSAEKITKFLDSQPLGAKISIGNVDYYGTGKGNMKSGIEVDKATGQGMYYEFNPETGRTTTIPMGTVGYADPNWTIERDDDGNLWRVSASTDQAEVISSRDKNNSGNANPMASSAPPPVGGQTRRLPMTPGAAQRTLNAVLPEGSTGPTLPGHEYNAGQCGAYANYCYGQGIFGNTIQQKTEALKQFPAVSPDQIQTNNTFVMKSGTTGHVGLVGDVVHDPKTGEITGFMANESNYVPPNGGKVSYSRFVSIKDPRLVGFADIPTPNLPSSGTDSVVTNVASGGAVPESGYGKFGQRNDSSNQPASIKEYEYAKKSGGFQGNYVDFLDRSKSQSTSSNVDTAAQGIANGDLSISDIPSDQRAQAIKTAKEKYGFSSDAKDIADAIVSGNQSPDLKGLYGKSSAVRAELQKQGFNLKDAQNEWSATQTFLKSANSQKQLQLQQAEDSVLNGIGELRKISSQFSRYNFTPANKTSIIAAANGVGPERDIAAQYLTQVNLLKDEMGSVFMGGGSPTDKALGLATEALNKDYGHDQLMKSLDTIEKNLQFRKNAMDNALPRTIGGNVPSTPQVQKPTENPPQGMIWVSTKDGQIGAIPSEKFNSNKYTKL